MFQHLALSDNGFLFDTRSGRTFSLSSTGTFLLQALMTGAEMASLPERLMARFEVDATTAGRDCEQFMFRLRDLGLTPENAAGAASVADGIVGASA